MTQPSVATQVRLLNGICGVIRGLLVTLRVAPWSEKHEHTVKHLQDSLARLAPVVNQLVPLSHSTALADALRQQVQQALITTTETTAAAIGLLLGYSLTLKKNHPATSENLATIGLSELALLKAAGKAVDNDLCQQTNKLIGTLLEQAKLANPDHFIRIPNSYYVPIRDLVRYCYHVTKSCSLITELKAQIFDFTHQAGFPISALHDLIPLESNVLKPATLTFNEFTRIADAAFYMQHNYHHYPLMLQVVIWLGYEELTRKAEHQLNGLANQLQQLHERYLQKIKLASAQALDCCHAEKFQLLQTLLTTQHVEAQDTVSHFSQVLACYETLAENLAATRNSFGKAVLTHAYELLRNTLMTHATHLLTTMTNDVHFYLNTMRELTQWDSATMGQFSQRILAQTDIFRGLLALAPDKPLEQNAELSTQVELAHTFWLHLQFSAAGSLYATLGMKPYTEIACAFLALGHATEAIVFLKRHLSLHEQGLVLDKMMIELQLASRETSLINYFDAAVNDVCHAVRMYTSVDLATFGLTQAQLELTQPLTLSLRENLLFLNTYAKHLGAYLNELDATRWNAAHAQLVHMQQIFYPETPKTKLPDVEMQTAEKPITENKKKKKRAKQPAAVLPPPSHTTPSTEPISTHEARTPETPAAALAKPTKKSRHKTSIPRTADTVDTTPDASRPIESTELVTTEFVSLHPAEARCPITSPSTPATSSATPVENSPPRSEEKPRMRPPTHTPSTREGWLALLTAANQASTSNELLSYSFQSQLIRLAPILNHALHTFHPPDFALCHLLRPLLLQPKINPWLASKLTLPTEPHLTHDKVSKDARWLYPMLWFIALGVRGEKRSHAIALEQCALDFLQVDTQLNPDSALGSAFGCLLFAVHFMLFTQHRTQLRQASNLLENAQSFFQQHGSQQHWSYITQELQVVCQSRLDPKAASGPPTATAALAPDTPRDSPDSFVLTG